MLLLNLADRVRRFDLSDIKLPEGEVQEGEEVIGILPDELKGLYTVTQVAGEKVNRLVERLKKQHPKGRARSDFPKEATDAIDLALMEYTFAKECLWSSTRYAFAPHIGADNIGVREGWKVVVYDDPPRGAAVVLVL